MGDCSIRLAFSELQQEVQMDLPSGSVLADLQESLDLKTSAALMAKKLGLEDPPDWLQSFAPDLPLKTPVRQWAALEGSTVVWTPKPGATLIYEQAAAYRRRLPVTTKVDLSEFVFAVADDVSEPRQANNVSFKVCYAEVIEEVRVSVPRATWHMLDIDKLPQVQKAMRQMQERVGASVSDLWSHRIIPRLHMSATALQWAKFSGLLLYAPDEYYVEFNEGTFYKQAWLYRLALARKEKKNKEKALQSKEKALQSTKNDRNKDGVGGNKDGVGGDGQEQERGYRVRAGVRDSLEESRTAHLKALPGAMERLSIIKMDLEDGLQSTESCTTNDGETFAKDRRGRW